MNGHQDSMNGGETISYTEECFHCSSHPEKFSSLLSKEQQPYCNKCFQNMFVVDVKNGGSETQQAPPVFKTKPPPPPKPKGKNLILFSTLPKPYHSTMTSSTTSVIPSSTEYPSSPKTPPPPSPPPIDSVFSVPVEEPLPPPPPLLVENNVNLITSATNFDRKTSPLPTYGNFTKTPSPPSSTLESSSSWTTPSPSSNLGIDVNNGFRKTPSPVLSRQVQAHMQQHSKPAFVSTNKDFSTRGTGKPVVQSAVLAAVQAEQEEEKLKKASVGSGQIDFKRQQSGDQEESHLDQLSKIFKITSLKQRPADIFLESEVNDSQSSSSTGKPPIAANKPSFNCSKCRTNLLGKTVESKGGKVLCTPCYRVELANQHCVKCGDAFTPDNHSVTYQNESYHIKCFCCDKCELPIGSKTFCKQKDSVYCSDCYFEVSGRICVKCKKYLTSTGFIFRNEPWHHACFCCGGCQKPLGDQEIFCKEDQPYCLDCFDQDLEKCAACGKKLIGETVEYEQKSYHDDCFCCVECKSAIGSASFFPREGKVFCEKCFSVKFGKKCKKCQLLISPSSGFGLVFRDSHFHRSCFVCVNCNISLAGIPVHSTKTSDDIFCGDCYDNLYAKKCAGCQQIISGVVGSRFMSFQDKAYHVDCFVCKMCQTSLENRKFSPGEKGEILCIACSRFSPYSQ